MKSYLLSALAAVYFALAGPAFGAALMTPGVDPDVKAYHDSIGKYIDQIAKAYKSKQATDLLAEANQSLKLVGDLETEYVTKAKAGDKEALDSIRAEYKMALGKMKFTGERLKAYVTMNTSAFEFKFAELNASTPRTVMAKISPQAVRFVMQYLSSQSQEFDTTINRIGQKTRLLDQMVQAAGKMVIAGSRVAQSPELLDHKTHKKGIKVDMLKPLRKTGEGFENGQPAPQLVMQAQEYALDAYLNALVEASK